MDRDNNPAVFIEALSNSEPAIKYFFYMASELLLCIITLFMTKCIIRIKQIIYREISAHFYYYSNSTLLFYRLFLKAQ